MSRNSSPALSPPPVVETTKTPPLPTPLKAEPIAVDAPPSTRYQREATDEPEPIEQPDDVRIKQMNEAKQRHQADLVKHAYEPPRADRPQDDWQVAYVWAFIVKFNQRAKIPKLECLEDFEKALEEPIANQPDDILEGILVRFMSNLKPGTRTINSSTIQKILSNYIDDRLSTSTEFTAWDRPWAPNEEARGGCCSSAPNRQELGRLRYPGEPDSERLGRNPMKKIMEAGGGLFELEWRERVRILRQLVDWQLTECDQIKAIINSQNHIALPKTTRVPESLDKVSIEPIGLDRNKNRIWALDNSGRLYKSANPFKRPCPLYALSSNSTEFSARIDEWKAHGESSTSAAKSNGSGSKGKMSKQEQAAHVKMVKGIKAERELAEKAAEMIEAVDKEEQRIVRARKKAAEINRFAQQAEFRSTRTRRPARKVDYTYDGVSEDDEAPRRSGRGAASYAPAQPTRAVIPGERKSARQAAKEAQEAQDAAGSGSDDDGASDVGPNGNGNGNDHDHGGDDDDQPNVNGLTPNANGSDTSDADNADADADAVAEPIDLDEDDNGRAKKRKNGKGWMWVEESVDVRDMTKDEKERYERAMAKREHAAAPALDDQRGREAANGAEDAIEID